MPDQCLANAWLMPNTFSKIYILVSSKEFWSQVDRENISNLAAQFAYKHDFEMFDYSIKEYLQKLDLI